MNRDASFIGRVKAANSSDEVVYNAKEQGHNISVTEIPAKQLEQIGEGGECVGRSVDISVENLFL